MPYAIRQPITRANCILAALLMLGAFVPFAQAGTIEVIPSVGMTKSTDKNAGDGQLFGGLAVRMPVLPLLKLEGGLSYRQDEIASTDIQIRQWPLTMSLWFTPTPMFYGGAGIGWYRTTLDFPEALPVKDSTTQKVGVHLGGGVLVPMSPNLGLDFSGRYIFMQADDTTPLIPDQFDPDFWSLGIGLAFSF